MTALTPWIREYSLRDLLDDPFDLFKACAPSLLLAGVLPFSAVVLYLALTRIFLIPGNLLREFTEDAFRDMLLNWRFWVFASGLTIVSIIATTIGYLAQCRIATHCALGEAIPLRAAFARLGWAFWSLLFIAIVANLLISVVAGTVGSVSMVLVIMATALAAAINSVTLGVVLVAIATGISVLLVEIALLFSLSFFITGPIIIVMESPNPLSALSRSFRMAGANMKAHLVALYAVTRLPLVISFMVFAVVGALVYATDYVSPTFSIVIQSLLLGLTSILCIAICACAQALIYMDGRCRLEAYDLHVLANSLGLSEAMRQATTPAVSAPARTTQIFLAAPTAAPVAPVATNQPVSLRVVVPGLTPPPPAPGYPDYMAPPPGVEITIVSAHGASTAGEPGIPPAADTAPPTPETMG